MRYLHILLFAFICLKAKTQTIRCNQLGFYPHASKLVVMTGTGAGNFYLLNEKNDTVYTGKLSEEHTSPYASAPTRIADLTAFDQPGKYRLHNTPIIIRKNAQQAVAIASLKGFYYQRVSMPLQAAYAGAWARDAGHPDTAVLIHPSAATRQRPAGTTINSSGGWYDAGDYNKYIVNCGITMNTLLAGYEDFPKYFDTLNTNIPESGNRLPDLLDEILYNLRWMFTMQDPYDGGVYNKCTNAAFDGMVMPGVTKLPRYVVQKGTAATLDFAAVMAQAARVYKKHLPALSDSCLKAAEKAWQWALRFPAQEYDQDAMNKQFDPDISTGGYGDKKFDDEWFWAACELFVATNSNKYFSYVQQYFPKQLSVPAWNTVQILGTYALAKTKTGIAQKAKQQLVQFANGLVQRGDKAYGTVMGQSISDFIWGSNSTALNQSIVLINTYLVTGRQSYLNWALQNLDYVLGRNATGYSYVTGMGNKRTMHPHHRPSVADGIAEPVPGLLAGGPNPGKQDRCEGYPSNNPAECYLDHDCSYASNEIAINWNAPLVYVANALEALMK